MPQCRNSFSFVRIGWQPVFITTKLWNSDQGYDKTLAAFDKSNKTLGLDYVDLYLIHWPGKELFVETYKAMERLLKEGRVRAIGVSNFKIHHLETLMQETDIVPAVNQVELHPDFSQPELREWCQSRGIAIEAWRPISKGAVNEEPVICDIAKAHGKTPVQVALRWHLQHDIIVIPKSVHQDRIISNAQLWDFELTQEEMQRMDALDRNNRLSSDPDVYFEV